MFFLNYQKQLTFIVQHPGDQCSDRVMIFISVASKTLSYKLLQLNKKKAILLKANKKSNKSVSFYIHSI